MRILFLARHFTYYRNFEGAIRDLARRGHQVHLAVDREDGRAIAERLAAEWTGVTCGMTPEVAMTAIPWYIIAGFNAVQSVLDVVLAWVVVYTFKLNRFSRLQGETLEG